MISKEEWLEVLRELKIGIVPDISGISYILIKKVSEETQEIFRKFAE